MPFAAIAATHQRVGEADAIVLEVGFIVYAVGSFACTADCASFELGCAMR
jgi:hypothetical protein